MPINHIRHILGCHTELITQLSDHNYSNACEALSGATIGEHTRHIIELFTCLVQSYESGLLNYDNRKRDKVLEKCTATAVQAIKNLEQQLDKPDKTLKLQQQLGGEDVSTETNYTRELLYNLEHCIHHQALIKVALRSQNIACTNENFGVAASTIAYRKQCVQ